MFAHCRRVLAKLRFLLRSRHAEEDLERELAAHLALLEDDLLHKGMTREPRGARR